MASTATLSDSRSYINDSCATLRSSFSGTSPPSSPVAGQPYFNTSTYAFSMYSGSSWYQIFTVGSTYGGLLPLSAGASYPLTDHLYCGGNQIKNIADPSLSTDAVSLNYIMTNYLPLAGGTMSGNIVLGSNFATCTATPTSDDHLARKAYVDLHVEKAGDTMTGDLSFGSSYTATGLIAPSSASDAATKSYVDDEFDTATGHDHDGTDSKKVEFSSLAATGCTGWMLVEATPDDTVVGRWYDTQSTTTPVALNIYSYTTIETLTISLNENEERVVMFGCQFDGLPTDRVAWRLRRDAVTVADDNLSGYWRHETLVFAVSDYNASTASVTYTLEAQSGEGSVNANHPWIVVL